MFEGASISLAPLIPPPALIALAVIAALLAAYGLARRARGSVLRVLAFAALLATLANPSWVQERREPLSDVAVIVDDRSASQRIDGREEETAVAVSELEQRLRRLPGTEVRVVRVTDAAGSESEREDEGTRLFSTLERALADLPRRRIAGVIAVTDGQIHDAPESADALELTAPFHVLLTGRDDEIEGDSQTRRPTTPPSFLRPPHRPSGVARATDSGGKRQVSFRPPVQIKQLCGGHTAIATV